MSVRTVHTEAAPAAIGPYSQAAIGGGLVCTAGQIALDPATVDLVEGDVVAQARRVFTNLFSNSSGNPPFSTAISEIPLNGSSGFLIDDAPRISTRLSTNLVQDGEELGLAVIFPTSQNNILQSRFVTPNSASWNFGFQRELFFDLGTDNRKQMEEPPKIQF